MPTEPGEKQQLHTAGEPPFAMLTLLDRAGVGRTGPTPAAGAHQSRVQQVTAGHDLQNHRWLPKRQQIAI